MPGFTSRWISPQSWACVQPDRRLRDELGGGVRDERPLLGHDLVERRPGDVLGDDEVRALPVADVQHPRDGRVVDLRGRPHFVQERLKDGRVGRPVGRQHLQRDQLLGSASSAWNTMPTRSWRMPVEDLVLVEDEPAACGPLSSCIAWNLVSNFLRTKRAAT